jgi:hypothetical protein
MAVCRDDLQAGEGMICLPSSGYASIYECSTYTVCGFPLALAEDQDPVGAGEPQVLVDTFERYANCYFDSQRQQWDCGCSDAFLNITRTLVLPNADTSVACDTAEVLCNSDIDFQPEGEVTCSVRTLNASASSCQAQTSCTQPGLLDGNALSVVGEIDVYCDRVGSGYDWGCYCGSLYGAFNSEQFTISGDLGLEACDDALDQCRGLAVYAEASGLAGFSFDPLPVVTTDAGVP